MSNKRNLSFWQMWNLSFGFFGVQIAYALQSANMSRIFATLGADPHALSFFWVLPPLMGMIVQPIVGAMSDKTWCRWGRRKPYLYVGSIVAVIVMALLPNSGSFNLSVKAALGFGAIMLMLLDTSINMAMQPFKMMVGDMVNEEQKTKAYSIQSMLCNAGSFVGYLFPYFFTWIGIKNTAPDGVVPPSVTWSFYIGAAILILCVLFTGMKVKEMNPEEYAAFHGIEPAKKEEKKEKTNIFKLLVKAPKAFWQIGLVQFFSWFAFLYMWNNTTGAIAENVWGTLNPASKAYQDAGDWTGVLFAVQAVGSIIWALVLPKFRNVKVGYALSLVIGAVGFISTQFVTDQYALFVSFLLIGAAWAAMLAMPFAMLTNSLSGKSMGTYLGLFNCTICLPQIVAALVGGMLLTGFGGEMVTVDRYAAEMEKRVVALESEKNLTAEQQAEKAFYLNIEELCEALPEENTAYGYLVSEASSGNAVVCGFRKSEGGMFTLELTPEANVEGAATLLTVAVSEDLLGGKMDVHNLTYGEDYTFSLKTAEGYVSPDEALASGAIEMKNSGAMSLNVDVVLSDGSTVKCLFLEPQDIRSGQGVMLVIAGISLILGAIAVFGIKTKKATK